MLYKNDEPHTLTAKEKESVLKFVGKYPAVIKFTDAAYSVHPDGKKRRPYSVNLPLEEVIFTENIGSVKWNYCESPPKMDKITQEWTYPRKTMPMYGQFVIGSEKIDLIWFFINVSSLRELRDDETNRIQVSRPLFKIENKRIEAAKKSEGYQLQARVYELVWGPSAERERLESYAYALGIGFGKTDTDQEIQVAVFGKINSEKDGAARFLKLINDERKFELLSIVKKAIANDIIKYHEQSLSWNLVDGKKQRGQEICKQIGGMTAEDSIISAIERDKSILLMLGEVEQI